VHKVVDFLKRAVHAEAQAEHAANGPNRSQLMDIAREWRELARQAASLAEDADGTRPPGPEDK
jgi:hypothetical protein